jgi:hypothetical protein
MFDIPCTMELDPDDMCIDKGAYGQCQRGVEIGRRGVKSRYQSNEIADQDVKKNGGNKGEKESSFRARDLNHKIFKPAHDYLQNILPLARDEFDAPGQKNGSYDHDKRHYPGVDYMNVYVKKVLQPDG